INHFPGMEAICRKNHLARNTARLSRRFPNDYNFMPRTWQLPADYNDLKRAFQAARAPGKLPPTFIAKPSQGCQGRGIFLTQQLADIEDLQTSMVVQRYLPDPLLIDGLKFDLRVYVLVASVNPLKIWLFDDGLARFATVPYAAPSPENLACMPMHLTNYKINKDAPGFVHSDREDMGSKQSIKAVLARLRREGAPVDQLWHEIGQIICKTLLMIQPELASNLRAAMHDAALHGVQESPCFEVLGFDIMMDRQYRPWILEVNHSPSFTCDQAIDLRIK
ncbi:tubulin-tyrosine ligase, partial [Caulochytrium protostelioides]